MNLYHNDYIKFRHNGVQYAVLVQRDDSPMNPRIDWDWNLDFMICFHPEYALGDRNDYKDPEAFWRELVRENVPTEKITEAACNGELYSICIEPYRDDDNTVDVYEHYALRTILGNSQSSEALEYEGISRDSIADYILDDLTIKHCQQLLKNYIVWLPLYYSGSTINTTGFSYPWGSKQVGWIYMTRESFLAETGWGETLWPQRAIEMMQGSVKTYNQYLTGDVYGFTVYKNTGTEENPSWDETDNACWGFYDGDIKENGIADNVPGLLAAIESGAYETGTATEHIVTTITYDFD